MKLLLLAFFSIISYSNGAKILAVTSMCAHSHFTLNFRIVKELVDNGHDVTFVSSFPQKVPIKHLRDIPVTEVCDLLTDTVDNLYEMGRMSYYGQLNFVHDFSLIYTEATLKNKQVQALLNSDETFDLVIMEHFVNDALMIFAHKFKCPLILVAPGPMTIFNSHLVGNPLSSAYVPNLLTSFGSNMSFWERLQNTYLDILGKLFVHWTMLPAHNDLLHKYVPDAPHLDDFIYNVSMMFLTSHISIGNPVPLQPNVKEIGGHHVAPPKPLPADLKIFLDNATEGVVLFSMGSNLKSAAFPPDKKRAVLKAFAKIKQKVLWKFETDLPEKPANVKILKWLPQQDVLAHPNVVVFISHVGLLGTIEGIFYGVPILGLPVFWDQTKNIQDAARRGMGIKLNFEDITDENFEAALNEILNNPKYRMNARIHSKIMHDQPMKKIDEAVFWVNYVIRHKGAGFLRSPATDLKWYQRHLIDIFCFVLLMILIVLSLVKVLIKVVLKINKVESKNKSKKLD